MPRDSYGVNPPPNFNSLLKQQKLQAWQPVLTAGTTLPIFFVLGLIFVPIGVLLLIASNNVHEYVYDYTDKACVANNLQSPDLLCKDVIKNATLMDEANMTVCECEIPIQIKELIPKPVFIYYGLANFYQNHRRYAKSRDDMQLVGEYMNKERDCEPFENDANDTRIFPCGAVANSMFNDTFEFKRDTSIIVSEIVPLQFTGIAWPSDRYRKFSNPKGGWEAVAEKTVKPLSWTKPIYNLSDDESQNGVLNESFIVWMRTAALPTFRKLHSFVDHKQKDYEDGLPAGNYSIRIGYNYPVADFDGRKRFIICNSSWAGGKNPFLGVACIVTGALCILTGLIFLVIHLKFGKTLTEVAVVN